MAHNLTETGESYVLNVDIYSPNTEVSLLLGCLDSNGGGLNSVNTTVPVNTEFTTYTLTAPNVEGTARLLISLTPVDVDKEVYVDNLICKRETEFNRIQCLVRYRLQRSRSK